MEAQLDGVGAHRIGLAQRPGLLVSTSFVFLSVLKELPLTLLLAPTGFDTLARDIWAYTEEAQYAQAAPAALVLLLSGVLLTRLLLSRQDHP